jgi:Fic family protein
MALSPHTEIYKEVVSRNQLRMFDLLKECFTLCNDNPNSFNLNMVFSLHHASMNFLLDEPGKLRTQDLHISYSDHIPPPSKVVPALMFDCIDKIREGLNDKNISAYSLAAFALWRINWIHPFEDGNGRLSRAICDLIIRVKTKKWQVSKTNLPLLIAENDKEYQSLLRFTDLTLEKGEANLAKLTDFIFQLEVKILLDIVNNLSPIQVNRPSKTAIQ